MSRHAFRASAANKFDAPILSNFSAAPHQHDANLAGALDVRSPARLQIGSLDFNGAQYAFALNFFSHPQSRKFVRRSVAHIDRTILENNLIGRTLGAFQYFFCWFRATQVNRREFGAEVERNRRQTEAFLKHGRQQMLSSVLLHVIEAPRPVNTAIHFRIRRLTINQVKNFVAFVANIENVGVADFAQIVGLASRRRIKRRAIQNQSPDAAGDSRAHIRREHFAMHHSRSELLFKRIIVVESARGHADPPLSDCSARCQASAYL